MKTVNVKGTLIVPRVEKLGTDKKATFLLLLLKNFFRVIALQHLSEKIKTVE
jgi:hypothetical protein